MPESVRDGQRVVVEEFVAWTNAWLHSIQGGLGRFIEEAGDSLLIYGLQIHEVVWGEDDEGRKHPVKFGYREPATIDEWVLSHRGDQLVAVDFDLWEGGGYTLPAMGPRLRDRKVLHSALGQRGNNFEGVSPIRPAIHWIKLKRLLGQLIGVAAEKYGVPIAEVTQSDEQQPGGPQGNADKSDVETLGKILRKIRASEGAVIEVPPDLDFELHAPSGRMPDFLDLLDYCDQQIAQQYANEGSLLGQGSAVGSYALAQQSDSKFLRQAPAIARKIFEPVERIIRWTWQAHWAGEHGDLPTYPTVEQTLSSNSDSSQWLADAVKLLKAGKTSMSQRQKQALIDESLDKLGVDLEDEASRPDPGDTDESDEVEREEAA
jgi:hypothetical protein